MTQRLLESETAGTASLLEEAGEISVKCKVYTPRFKCIHLKLSVLNTLICFCTFTRQVKLATAFRLFRDNNTDLLMYVLFSTTSSIETSSPFGPSSLPSTE